MLKLEEKDKIPERLENNLQRLRGSNFKEIKNLQFLEEVEEKMPEEVKERIEQKKEEIMERLREQLENMPPEQQGKLEEYLGDISGDEITVLDVFNALESKGLPENLEQIMERAKEQKVERITNRFQERIRQEAVSKERAEDKIKEAEESLDDLQKLIADREEVNQDDMPAVFRLLEESEKKLETAKEEFENQNYGRAYGQAVASLSLSRNAIRIIKIRAGFNTEIENLACAEVYNPVCGEDGTTYGNICKAKQAGVRITYRGECKEDMGCAEERERVNRNPLLGPTSQSCCEGLQEVRVSRSYSVCRNPDATFECQQDEDCPLPRCSGLESKCVDGRCVIPRCEEPAACIQVITPAKNPNTGECRNFPTPCDVPEGWEKVEACENIRARIEEAIQNRARSLSPSSAQ
ncbi:MAG: hypothetical protein GF370_00475 [Candidatus Nealsonbacteria bacterium]|nr:hypothetical protein [Candidatus Nealsonbacteria bacterium]